MAKGKKSPKSIFRLIIYHPAALILFTGFFSFTVSFFSTDICLPWGCLPVMAAAHAPDDYIFFPTAEEIETAFCLYADLEESSLQEGGTENGISEEGGTENGISEEGGTEDGFPQEGGTKDGIPEEGSTEDGILEEGGTEDGISEEGNPGENTPEDYDTGDDGQDEEGRADTWPEDGLAALLPVPEGDLDCLMIICDGPGQFGASLPTDQSSYESYVVSCMEWGFDQEAVSKTSSEENGLSSAFQAFNEDGYKIELRFYPWLENCFLEISVKPPMPLGTLKWWDYALGLLLPRPETTVGVVRGSPEVFLDSYLGEMPLASYHEYIEACKTAGFNQNAVETEREYFATDEDGIEFSASYYGNNIMWLRLFDPEQKWRSKGLGEAAAGGGEGGTDTIGGGEDGADSIGGGEDGDDSIGNGENSGDSTGGEENGDSTGIGENLGISTGGEENGGDTAGNGEDGGISTDGEKNGGDFIGGEENGADSPGDGEGNTGLFEDGEGDASWPEVIPVSCDEPDKDITPLTAEPADSHTSVTTAAESGTMASPAEDTPTAAALTPLFEDALAEDSPAAASPSSLFEDALAEGFPAAASHASLFEDALAEDSPVAASRASLFEDALAEDFPEEDAAAVQTDESSVLMSATGTPTEESNPNQGNLIMQITNGLPAAQESSPSAATPPMQFRNLPGQKTRTASAVAGLLAVCAILSGAIIKRRAFIHSL